MADAEDPTNAVGYKMPPLHSQFKPGVSGNAKGRPKGALNFATVIEQELRARIEVTENGRRKKISKREAIAKQTVNRAAAGDPKATSTLLNEARFQESQSPPSAIQSFAVGPEDQVVMNNMLQRIRQSEAPPSDPDSPAGRLSQDEPKMPADPK